LILTKLQLRRSDLQHPPGDGGILAIQNGPDLPGDEAWFRLWRAFRRPEEATAMGAPNEIEAAAMNEIGRGLRKAAGTNLGKNPSGRGDAKKLLLQVSRARIRVRVLPDKFEHTSRCPYKARAMMYVRTRIVTPSRSNSRRGFTRFKRPKAAHRESRMSRGRRWR